jgi:predicted aspartyl protease
MVRIALGTTFVLSLVAAAFASPIQERTSALVKVPLTKKESNNIKAVVASDKARIAKASGSGSGSITNEAVSYIAAVTVGTQSFNLIVDTGSSNLWVGADKKFTAGSDGSSTGKKVSVSYGSGSFSGTEYTDKVTFGGLTVDKQSLGVASTSTGFSGVDGIIGFGPVDLTEDTVSGESTVPTFMDNLKSTGAISTEVLGVSFAPLSGSSTSSKNGELTLGGTDSSKYSGSITYVDQATSGDFAPYWGIAVSEIEYSSTSVGSSLHAIVDTGTTLIYIPTSSYNKFLSAAGGKTDSSSGLAKFTKKPTGDFSFTIGGKKFELTPTQYLIPQDQLANLGVSGSGYYSWIGDGGSDSVDFIIGQKFLENYVSIPISLITQDRLLIFLLQYSVFDTTNKRVGLATAS